MNNVPVFNLTILPDYVGFACSRRMANKFAKSEGWSIKWDKSQLNHPASTLHKEDKLIRGILVFVNLDLCQSRNMTKNDYAALLAHEAIHVQKRVFERIGAESPDEESIAYLVQSLVGFMLYELDKVLKVK